MMATMKTIHVPTLSGGMETRKSPIDLNPNELTLVENLHWEQAKGWSSVNAGYVSRNATALNSGAPIKSIYTFTDVTGLANTLVQAGDTLYHVNPLEGTTIKTLGQTSASGNSYVPFLGWCFVLNESATPKRWNGNSATFETMLGWMPDFGASLTPGNPGFGCVFANRLVLSGDTSNPNVVYLSGLEDPENFTPDGLDDGPGAIQISPGDGQVITGLVPMYVPYSNEHVLLIFKSESIYALKGYDASTFRLELVSNNLGTVSPKSIITVGQDVWFLSKSGINALGPNTELGILSVGSISPSMQGRIHTLNQAQLNKAFALHDPIRQELWWCLPTGSANVANEVWVQHYGTRPYTWSIKTGLMMTCGHTLPLGQMLTGGNDGVWQQQRVGDTYNGASINWVLESATFALGNLSTMARLTMVDVYLSAIGSGAFDATCTWELGFDSRSDLIPSVTLSGSGANTYSVGFYGTALYDRQFKAIARLYPEGSGRLAELRLTGTSPAQPIAITGYSLTYIEGGGSKV